MQHRLETNDIGVRQSVKPEVLPILAVSVPEAQEFHFRLGLRTDCDGGKGNVADVVKFLSRTNIWVELPLNECVNKKKSAECESSENNECPEYSENIF